MNVDKKLDAMIIGVDCLKRQIRRITVSVALVTVVMLVGVCHVFY